MILFDNEYYMFSLDRKVPCLEWAAMKEMNSRIFRDSQIILIDLYKEQKKLYPKLELLVDARILGDISDDDTSWVRDVVLSQLAGAGLTKEAFVVQESTEERKIVEEYISKAGSLVELISFRDLMSAKVWLISQG